MKLLKGKRWKPTLCLVTFAFVHVVSNCAEVKPAFLVSHVGKRAPLSGLTSQNQFGSAVESLEGGTRNPCTW